ncbi:MAG TPA: flagellar biosynthetic protein FliR [Clostridiales bacterium]|nr:flagellar biosynthetic protein FliR [Clostridiales bacterium]
MQSDFNFTLLMLVFMRMTGCIVFSPVFGRRNLPVMAKVGLSLLLSGAVYPLVPDTAVEISSVIVLMITATKELLVGFIIGFIVNLFISVIVIGGEVIDLHMAMSIAHIYDPTSNVSMPVSGSFFYMMFIFIFFASNAHGTLIRLFAESCVVVPYGTEFFNTSTLGVVVGLFSRILIYAVQMTIPMFAAALITEVGMGLLSKAAPQINVFVTNIQFKILAGFFVLFLLIQPMSSFLERLIGLMLDNVSNVVKLLM